MAPRASPDAPACWPPTTPDGKVALLAAGTESAVCAGFSAGNVIKQIAGFVGGRGGGRPNMAQAGGSDASGIDAALDAAKAAPGGAVRALALDIGEVRVGIAASDPQGTHRHARVVLPAAGGALGRAELPQGARGLGARGACLRAPQDHGGGGGAPGRA
jgi:hypothetical protein